MYNNYIQTQTTVIGRNKKQIKLILSALLLSLAFGIFGGLLSVSPTTQAADLNNPNSAGNYDVYLSGNHFVLPEFQGKYFVDIYIVRYEGMLSNYGDITDADYDNEKAIPFRDYFKVQDLGNNAFFEGASIDLLQPMYSSFLARDVYVESGKTYTFYFVLSNMKDDRDMNPKQYYSELITYTAPQPVELPPNPIFDGYTFAGWFYDEAYTEPYANEPIYSNTSLYAGWYVTSTPTHEGYTFVDWYLDEELTISASDKVVSLDTEVYAGWKIVSIPEKEHYDFVGWYLDEELITSAANVVVNLETSLFPKYVNKLYIVSFVAEPLHILPVKLNSLTEFTPESLELLGYNFVGWYMDEGRITPYIDGTELTSSITLYAKFEVKTYTVTFYVGNKLHAELIVPYGSVLGEQPEVVALAEKYNMTGLYSDTALTMPIRTDTPITNELVLYASVDNDSQLDTFKGFGIGAGTVGIILVVVIVIFLLKRR